MDPPLHREARHQIKGWYRAAVDRALPPALVTLKRITAEQVELYRYISPPGANIPISVEPSPVDDWVTTEDEIKGAEKHLHNHLSRGPSGMRAEHLKGRLTAARKKEKEEAEEGRRRQTATKGGKLRRLRLQRHPTGRC